MRSGRIALVGETIADVREVMVNGESGLLSLDWGKEQTALGRLEAEAGASERRGGAGVLVGGSGEPARAAIRSGVVRRAGEVALRRGDMGHAAVRPQIGRAAAAGGDDDAAADPAGEAAPRRRRHGDDAGAHDRQPQNLAQAFLTKIVARYEGTRLGRQELDAELIEERTDALWHRAAIEACRVSLAPELRRIVVAVDPPASSGEGSDACGIVAAGIGAEGNGYVLVDATAERLSPARWAKRAVDLFHRLEADRIVAEVNQGGEMVEAVIRQADADVPVETVRARRGKYLRAEPVAALYEQGRVRHVGAFPELEDEMCDFALGGLSSGRSPTARGWSGRSPR